MTNAISKDKQDEEQKHKDVYRVWVEYLKESEGYKKFCETAKTRKKYPVELAVTYGWAQGLTFSTGLDPAEADVGKLYLVFGDIHSSKYDYERWWHDRMLRLIKYASTHAPPSILSWDKFIELRAAKLRGEMSQFIKQGRKRIPSTFFKELLTQGFGTNKQFMSLRVNSYYRMDVLVKEFIKIVKRHKKRHRITEDTEDLFHNLLMPTPIAGRAVSELEDYLKVFKLRKKPNPKKYEDIAREIGKGEYIDKEDGKLMEHPSVPI